MAEKSCMLFLTGIVLFVEHKKEKKKAVFVRGEVCLAQSHLWWPAADNW